MYASKYGRVEIVKELLKAGAKIYDYSHIWVPDDVIGNNHTEIVKIIKEQMIKDIMESKCLLLPYDIVHKIVIDML